MGHIYCGFNEGQEKAYKYLEKMLPDLAADLHITATKVEDQDPRPLYETSLNSAIWLGCGKLQADRHTTFQRLLSTYHGEQQTQIYQIYQIYTK